MHGQFDATLYFTPKGGDLLIVQGPLIANTTAELALVVSVDGALTQTLPDGTLVTENCNSNGKGFSPAPGPAGSTWTMNLHTNKIKPGVPASGHVRARVNGIVVAQWSQPDPTTPAPIQIQ
jgi:hypothetical protein